MFRNSVTTFATISQKLWLNLVMKMTEREVVSFLVTAIGLAGYRWSSSLCILASLVLRLLLLLSDGMAVTASKKTTYETAFSCGFDGYKRRALVSQQLWPDIVLENRTEANTFVIVSPPQLWLALRILRIKPFWSWYTWYVIGFFIQFRWRFKGPKGRLNAIRAFPLCGFHWIWAGACIW